MLVDWLISVIQFKSIQLFEVNKLIIAQWLVAFVS